MSIATDKYQRMQTTWFKVNAEILIRLMLLRHLPFFKTSIKVKERRIPPVLARAHLTWQEFSTSHIHKATPLKVIDD